MARPNSSGNILRIKVQDSNGVPVHAASIALLASESAAIRTTGVTFEPLYDGTSDEEGVCTFVSIPDSDQNFRVVVTKFGFRRSEHIVAPNTECILVLQRSDLSGFVMGAILDNEKMPIPDVPVLIEDTMLEKTYYREVAKTSPQGLFEVRDLDSTAKSVRLLIVVPGFIGQLVNIPVNTPNIRVELQPDLGRLQRE